MLVIDYARRLKRTLLPTRDACGFPTDAWTDELYAEWFEAHKATNEQLSAQRDAEFANGPLFSVIVPLYKTPLDYLRNMVDSVLAQTYKCFELILVNASSDMPQLGEEVRRYCGLDPRVVEVVLDENLGIAENTNAGIAAASGDFLCFLDHDDFIEPDALFHYAAAVDGDGRIDVLYCDEDLVEPSKTGGMVHKHPFFKPDYSPELMLCKNAIIHMMAIRRSLVAAMPIPDSRYDGAQDYNMVLFATMNAQRVHHESRVLYHWRMTKESTANNPDAKKYARLASRLAIGDNLKNSAYDARIVGSGILNTQNLWFGPSEGIGVSLVVVCDSRDEAENFARLFEATNSHKDVEMIFVVRDDDGIEGYGSEAGETKFVCAKGHDCLFGLANEGARAARGDYLVFFRGGSLFQTPEPLEQMLGLCTHDGIGVVAPKSLYSDGSVKCCGVAITPERIMPLYRGYPDDFPGYQCGMRAFQNNSATGFDGMMVRHSVFGELGGFDEAYESEIGVADFCTKVRKAGYRIVQTPTVKVETVDGCPARRYDNKSNAPDFTSADLALFDEKWPGLRIAGDPYFNRNLDQSSSYFQVACREHA